MGRVCSQLGCEKPASYEVGRTDVILDAAYGTYDACLDHVGHLMTEYPNHWVALIE